MIPKAPTTSTAEVPWMSEIRLPKMTLFNQRSRRATKYDATTILPCPGPIAWSTPKAKDSRRMVIVVLAECVSLSSRIRREITSLRSRWIRAATATTSAKKPGAAVAAAIPDGRPELNGSAAWACRSGRSSRMASRRNRTRLISGFPRIGADHEITLDRSEHGYSALIAQLVALCRETFGMLKRDRVLLPQAELDIVFLVEHADFDDVRRFCLCSVERNGELIDGPVIDEFDTEVFHFRDLDRFVIDLDVEEIAVVREVGEGLLFDRADIGWRDRAGFRRRVIGQDHRAVHLVEAPGQAYCHGIAVAEDNRSRICDENMRVSVRLAAMDHRKQRAEDGEHASYEPDPSQITSTTASVA